MAILANRAAMERPFGLLKNSFHLIRSFSASAATPPTSSTIAATSTSASKKPKRKKKKNLFEVAQFLPNWGIGYQMAKTHWVGLSYQITKINLYKDGRHGKAWGIVHKEGLAAADAPRKISGVHKRCWKYIPTKKTIESKTTESTPKAEVQAA
ncbi:28S ribosomal S34 protein [Thalictrum thalictroides]|uniref:28S ribosomal S34 protein n=1 Tax=Thalictrum thalictroides TaxID=46969 RepID=A0A7J6V3F4_THATH|nr:28S ribosomal S34 protein [Thalictrum thalictroides]